MMVVWWFFKIYFYNVPCYDDLPSGNLLQFAIEHGHKNSWFTQ